MYGGPPDNANIPGINWTLSFYYRGLDESWSPPPEGYERDELRWLI